MHTDIFKICTKTSHILSHMSNLEYCHVFRGVWLDGVWIGWIGFVDHLYTPLRTALYGSLTQISVLSLH
jgi:hypothetical protein